MRIPADARPLLLGAGLVGLGVLLRVLRPRALDLPRRDTPLRRPRNASRGEVARFARDGITEVLPDNLSDSVGRSLLLIGAGLIVARALDEIADDDGLL